MPDSVMLCLKSSSNLIKFCDGEGNVLSMKREEGRRSEKIDDKSFYHLKDNKMISSDHSAI